MGERGRLRPPPAPAHAPLLLGLDAAGGEHPQGPDDPDDQALVGRCWGCVCGWRGRVRDVATRHFRPQVGDGGGLRRRRLARADRDTRGELENHLAATAPPPLASTPPAVAAASPRVPGGEATGRARGPRRRLTLPRTTTLDGDPLIPAPAPAPTPADERGGIETPGPAPAPATEPEALPLPQPPAAPIRDTSSAPTTAGAEPPPDPDDRNGGGHLDQPTTPAPARAAAPGSGSGEDTLTANLTSAATRARAARADLDAAETALDAAVAAARADGASWRTIARATGIPHRDAAARWDPEGAGPSL